MALPRRSASISSRLRPFVAVTKVRVKRKAAMRFKILNPTAGLYNNRAQLHAAPEFACLDLVGQRPGVPVHDLLGGKLRGEVRFASYLFLRYPNPETGEGEVRTIEQLLGHATELEERYGFAAHKLKGGVYPPEHELTCYRALAEAFPSDTLRYDPTCALSVEEGIRFGRRIEDLNNDYYEDPTWGLNGMRRVREAVGLPLSTNTVVNFEQLAMNILDPAADVILLDTTFWGGIRPCVKAAGVCETFQHGVAVHSSEKLGIQLATMLHLGAAVPNLTFSADAHYHHLEDDVIEGGKLQYREGAIKVPSTPGLGVRLDREKLERYAGLYRELGGYPYDRDPGHPERYALVPRQRFADPDEGLKPSMAARRAGA